MMFFDDEDELEEWLDGLDYDGFWKAMETFAYVQIDGRAAIDAQIAEGTLNQAEVLDGLKAFAQVAIAEAQDLLPRIIEPLGPSMRIH